MANYECPNCGNIISSNDPECKYCGTRNPNCSFSARAVPVRTSNSNGAAEPETSPKKNNFSVGIFIVLLIFFWPGAVIYAIVASTKK